MNMNRVKIGIIILLLFTAIVSGQRTDFEETKTTHSEISEYTTIFYNTTGNDSIYYFDSDTYDTHILTLNGHTGNLTVNKGNVTVAKNIIATAFFGDGGNLTNLPAGFVYSDWFNQLLNTTNSPTFNDITLTSYPNLDKDSTDDITVEADPWFNSSIAKTLQQSWLNNWNTSFGWGTHTGLYSLLGHIHDFNYSGYNQDLNTSSLVEFENVTIDDTLDFTNGGTTWNIYINATGVLVWEIK